MRRITNMVPLLLVAICVSLGSPTEGFLHQDLKENLKGKDVDDPGEPLFLTPFIESGNITEGRSLARVSFTDNSINIKSYAGFFTVNKTYDTNQFFWYFPAMVNATDAPVLLQIGSSIESLVYEAGPLTVINNSFVARDHHWALNHHVIYIDCPIGVGFTFTKDNGGYCADETQVGEQLYSSIIQFFQLFPELQNNKLYLTGTGYAGKFIAALAYTIHKKNPTAALKTNLKGLAIGNGFCDPEHQLGFGQFLYQIGLIDWIRAEQFEKLENQTQELIQQRNWDNAVDNYYILRYWVNELTGLEYIANYISPFHYIDYISLMQIDDVRKGIHVGKLPFNMDYIIIFQFLKRDIMQSVAPIISELLDYYDVLSYSGQLDLSVPYTSNVNFLRHLNFTGSADYEIAERHIWKVDGDVAGYVKKAGRLTEALVRNAGMMVAADQPEWALDLITRFTHEQPLYEP